jgi:hypothetical protein
MWGLVPFFNLFLDRCCKGVTTFKLACIVGLGLDSEVLKFAPWFDGVLHEA